MHGGDERAEEPGQAHRVGGDGCDTDDRRRGGVTRSGVGPKPGQDEPAVRRVVVGEVGDGEGLRLHPRGGGGEQFGPGRAARASAGRVVGPRRGAGLAVFERVGLALGRGDVGRVRVGHLGQPVSRQPAVPRERAGGVGVAILRLAARGRVGGARRVFHQPGAPAREPGLVVAAGAEKEQGGTHGSSPEIGEVGSAAKPGAGHGPNMGENAENRVFRPTATFSDPTSCGGPAGCPTMFDRCPSHGTTFQPISVRRLLYPNLNQTSRKVLAVLKPRLSGGVGVCSDGSRVELRCG